MDLAAESTRTGNILTDHMGGVQPETTAAPGCQEGREHAGPDPSSLLGIGHVGASSSPRAEGRDSAACVTAVGLEGPRPPLEPGLPERTPDS